ncbi:rhodanese-like domain-containing protein [Desulfomicrobium baculatum]|uniref:Rhodanese domain protein n=1 Tax=Desulfomicrobium baculatum (strain DSM 4028 / VKM B-1378 / X) TaxID=525897 RepID=C7LVN0_DESBD|nr:rhodanese-like domain-containing protein [Desulfomicrobium baculatum]ACU88509.1 Rhodanese domain protein [Desulfomicrobium baculatum DSM 4028]
MKPPISFGIKTAIILAISVGLALAFNATRPDRLPLVHDPDSAAQAAAQRGEISLDEAALLFESGKAVFVDAREAGEYALGHIEGALSLDPVLFGQEFPALREHLEEATTIVTYCDGEFCELSHELAQQLLGMGLQDVRVLKNGWTLWRDQGLPTATGSQTTEPPQAPQAEEASVNASTGETPHATEPSEPESDQPAPAQTGPSDQQLQPAPPKEAPADSFAPESAPLGQPLEPDPQETLAPNPAPPEPEAETPSAKPAPPASPSLDPETLGEKS